MNALLWREMIKFIVQPKNKNKYENEISNCNLCYTISRIAIL